MISGGGAPSASPEPDAYFSVGGTVAGLGSNERLILSLADTQLEVDQDGAFVFADFTRADAPYEVIIVSAPPRLDCDIEGASGITEGQDVTDIDISCSSNATTEL
ncbi:MAG: hypothetical protein P8M13_06470, partial [Luminiphilus sp.]|nr:hypothetical protein [Luminiphilus sp.]